MKNADRLYNIILSHQNIMTVKLKRLFTNVYSKLEEFHRSVKQTVTRVSL